TTIPTAAAPIKTCGARPADCCCELRRSPRCREITISRLQTRPVVSDSDGDSGCCRHLQHHLSLPIRPSQGSRSAYFFPHRSRGHDHQALPGAGKSRTIAGRSAISSAYCGGTYAEGSSV